MGRSWIASRRNARIDLIPAKASDDKLSPRVLFDETGVPLLAERDGIASQGPLLLE